MLRASGAILALVLAAAAGAARAGVIDTLNDARRLDCGLHDAVRLNDDRRLDAAAQSLKYGKSLRDALAAAGYRADEVTALHVTQIHSQSQLRREVAQRFCNSLRNLRFADAGVDRQADAYWIIVAAPFAPPRPAAAVQVEQQVLALVNDARAQRRRCGGTWFEGAPALQLDPHLHEAALAHAREMAAHARLEHSGLDGSTPAQRVRRTGLEPLAEVGENIAAGAMDPREVVEGWLNSPGHCANIMNGHYQWMGLGFAVNERAELGIYWAQEFAALYPRQ